MFRSGGNNMQVIAGTRAFSIEEPTSVTIGKFDGRHKGHQKLLREMMELKQKYGYKIAVFTFDMAPAGVVSGKKQTVITTNQERRNNMEKMGVDYLVEYPFDMEVAHMTAEEFVAQILVGQMHARAIVAGTDCGFGYQRSGNAELLRKLAPKYGYETVIIEKEQDDHRDISSTYVREELDLGNIEKANELLGEPYSIHGIVVHGNHIGGPRLGFPTANILPPPEKHLPPFGVYVSRVLVRGRYYSGVTNIGRKPTVEGNAPIGVETFLLDLEGEMDLYGEMIEVQLLNFERPEQKFASLDDLKARIELDKKYAAEYMKKHPECK
jgi:riboflavin kinase/FMN adenylyltransferase